jgi:uncharacterized protein YbaP (TraB family)
MKRLLSLFAGLGLLVLPAPLLSREAKAKAANPALWVAKDRDTTIYLFGSVHVLKPRTIWFQDKVRAAFDASDMLVLEMVEPPQAEMAKEISKLGIDAEGPPLTRKLGPEAAEKYKAAMTGANLPWQQFERFRPWLAGVTLAVAPLAKLGYDSSAGVETVLTNAAKQRGKRVEGLETAAEQLGYFASLPESQQIAFLNDTVNELPKAEDEFASLVAAWEAGKPKELAKQMNQSMEATPELAKVLLHDRNKKWAQWIDERMERPGTVFVAVGAGHLAGPGSVQDALKALGIKAKRIEKVKAEK